MARGVPSYGRLQDEVASATAGKHVTRILDLGTGTGVTARRLLDVHPRAELVGIDENPVMLGAARQVLPADADLRMARLEDPLPAGPFDLVVSVLAVHHLDGAGKAELFRRIADAVAPGGQLVLGDVVVPEDPRDSVTPIDRVYDKPSSVTQQLEWLRAAGFIASISWLERDLAVMVGDLENSREG